MTPMKNAFGIARKKDFTVCSRRFTLNLCSYATISTTTRKIKVISLDAMHTIIRPIERVPVIYARFACKHGIIPPSLMTAETKRKEAVYKVLGDCFQAAFQQMEKRSPCYGCTGLQHGNGTASAASYRWWKDVIKEAFEGFGNSATNKKDFLFNYNPPESYDELASEIYGHFSCSDAWRLVEPNFATIADRIRRQNDGIKFVVTSNFDVRLHKILDDLQLYKPIFDAFFISGEMGVQKPESAVFERIMSAYSLSAPDEILHIGDSIDYDYKSAKKFGANALLFIGDRSLCAKQRLENGKDQVPANDIIFRLDEIEKVLQ